jgi:hypothetical protein
MKSAGTIARTTVSRRWRTAKAFAAGFASMLLTPSGRRALWRKSEELVGEAF